MYYVLVVQNEQQLRDLDNLQSFQMDKSNRGIHGLGNTLLVQCFQYLPDFHLRRIPKLYLTKFKYRLKRIYKTYCNKIKPYAVLKFLVLEYNPLTRVA